MLNLPEFCGKLLSTYRGRRRERQYQKYVLALLTGKVRLWDVPKRLRRDPEYGSRHLYYRISRRPHGIQRAL